MDLIQVTGPSGQMTWIRGGPECLDARNITEAIDNRSTLMCFCCHMISLILMHFSCFIIIGTITGGVHRVLFKTFFLVHCIYSINITYQSF